MFNTTANTTAKRIAALGDKLVSALEERNRLETELKALKAENAKLETKISELKAKKTKDTKPSKKASTKTSARESKASTKPKTAPEKKAKSATAVVGYANLSKDGKHSWNAFAFRSETYRNRWDAWTVDRLTMTFPSDICPKTF